MNTPERCMCGDPACWSCGPAQGYRYPPPTAHESALIQQLASQKVEERLYDSPEYFADLMDGVDGSDYYGQLQRALANRERACKGERIAMDAVLTALTIIDRALKPQAEKAWGEDCSDEATNEILGVTQE